MLLAGAEPFFVPGGAHAVLLIHGFTGSPSEMRLLGRYLAKEGYTVMGIRLAGHGSTPEDLERMRAGDWMNSVLDGYSFLAGMAKEVSVVGLSMGGLLAMLLSTVREVKCVASLAAPIFVSEAHSLHRLPSVERSVGRYLPRPHRAIPDIPANCNVAYRRMPMRSIHEMFSVLERMVGALPRVKAPILVMQSLKDHTVQPRSGQYIFDEVSSEYKKLVWLENSGHRVTIGADREEVFQKTAEFLQDPFRRQEGAADCAGEKLRA